MENTGILKISETEEAEIVADSVKFDFTITGENFVYGNAALEKCAEVKHLVEELKKLGVADDCFTVKSVYVKTETEFFGKTSKGSYQIVVHIKDLAQLSNALGAITAAKNCSLGSLEWVFDEDETKLELARQALLKAKRKADLMAEAIGYKITGIRTCSDSYSTATDRYQNNVMFAPQAAAPQSHGGFGGAPRVSVDIGTQFRGEKKIQTVVSAEFLIAKSDS